MPGSLLHRCLQFQFRCFELVQFHSVSHERSRYVFLGRRKPDQGFVPDLRNNNHIIGFVHLKDVLRQQYLGWKLDLRKLIRPALTVPDTMRLDRLLVRFQEQRNQLAIVVDEFGATRGMVTLEDVLEELVGELLTDHHQRVGICFRPRYSYGG